MKKALPWLLAAISLCFNVFFVFGLARGLVEKGKCSTPEGRADLLACAVEADEAQHAAILDAEKKSHGERVLLVERRDTLMERVWTELVKDEPDEGVFREFVKSEGSQGRHAAFLGKMRAIMKVLSPGQRAKAAEFLRKRAKRAE